MKDNLDNLDNEQQNPTPSKLEEPVILDETPNVETPQQQVNLDEPPIVETPQQQINLDETPNVETPQQPANLEAPPTDSTATPTVPAQHDDLDNPNPEYSETKKMEKIAAIVHNREEYRKQLEEDKRPTNEPANDPNDLDGAETPATPTGNLDGAETPVIPTTESDEIKQIDEMINNYSNTIIRLGMLDSDKIEDYSRQIDIMHEYQNRVQDLIDKKQSLISQQKK